jgi:hypothetical protein
MQGSAQFPGFAHRPSIAPPRPDSLVLLVHWLRRALPVRLRCADGGDITDPPITGVST